MITISKVERVYKRVTDVFSRYSEGYGDIISGLVGIETERLESFYNRVISGGMKPDRFFNAMSYAKERIEHISPEPSCHDRLTWDAIWDGIENPGLPAESSKSCISRMRTRMNTVFSRYEKEYAGRMPGIIGQLADYMNDVINGIIADTMQPEELAHHIRNANDYFYGMDVEPTEKEAGIWEEMWGEMGL